MSSNSKTMVTTYIFMLALGFANSAMASSDDDSPYKRMENYLKSVNDAYSSPVERVKVATEFLEKHVGEMSVLQFQVFMNNFRIKDIDTTNWILTPRLGNGLWEGQSGYFERRQADDEAVQKRSYAQWVDEAYGPGSSASIKSMLKSFAGKFMEAHLDSVTVSDFRRGLSEFPQYFDGSFSEVTQNYIKMHQSKMNPMEIVVFLGQYVPPGSASAEFYEQLRPRIAKNIFLKKEFTISQADVDGLSFYKTYGSKDLAADAFVKSISEVLPELRDILVHADDFKRIQSAIAFALSKDGQKIFTFKPEQEAQLKAVSTSITESGLKERAELLFKGFASENTANSGSEANSSNSAGTTTIEKPSRNEIENLYMGVD